MSGFFFPARTSLLHQINSQVPVLILRIRSFSRAPTSTETRILLPQPIPSGEKVAFLSPRIFFPYGPPSFSSPCGGEAFFSPVTTPFSSRRETSGFLGASLAAVPAPFFSATAPFSCGNSLFSSLVRLPFAPVTFS